MTKDLITQNQNLPKWQNTEKNSLIIYKKINDGDFRISNELITVNTSHLECIIQDKNELTILIAKHDKIIDKNECFKLIELFVIEIFEWFGKEISISLIKSLSKTIYENYYWFKISEFKLFVEKIKAGQWKQIHGLSPAVLMERLNDFALDSMNLRESLAVNSKQNTGNFLAENGELISEKLMPVFLRVNRDMENRKLSKLAISQIEEKKTSKKDFWKTHDWFSENKLCYDWLEKQEASQFVKLGWYQMFLLRKQKL